MVKGFASNCSGCLEQVRVRQRHFFGTGKELRDWIHVEDAARLLVLAGSGQQSTFEIYNGGFEQATTKDVLTRLAAAYGLAGEVTFTGETHKGNPRRLTSDCSHARRLLDWQPRVALQDGLERYSAWFKAAVDRGAR